MESRRRAACAEPLKWLSLEYEKHRGVDGSEQELETRVPHLSKSASGSKSTATCRPSSETFKLDNPRPPGQRRGAVIFAKVINRWAAISGAYHAPAQTHDLPRLSHIGLQLFVSPKALHRPLWANTIGSSLCCMRCSQLMDCVLEIVCTSVTANRHKQAANTRTIYYLHPLMSVT